MHDQHDLVTKPIPLLIRRLALPAATGFFFNTMFNVADTFFGGRISTEAVAALSLAFPVFFLIIATGSGISTGTTALISHALGEGNEGRARLLARQAVSFGMLNALMVMLVGLGMSKTLFTILGANEKILPLAVAYMQVIFSGSLFFILNYVFNALLTSTGDSRSFRNFLVAACLINLALDPLFLFGGFGVPAFGFAGIGWSTVAVQAMGVCYLCYRAQGTGLLDGFGLRDLLPRPRCYLDLARQGFPSCLNVMTIALGIFVITWFVGRYGSEAVAAYGIATRIEQIALLPVLGLNVATLALVARNSGAARVDRVAQAAAHALAAGVVLMAVGTAALFFGAERLVSLFTDDPMVQQIGVSCLRVECFACVAYVILYTCVAVMQGLKRPFFPLLIGLTRQIVIPVPVLYLLSVVQQRGVDGIWWGVLGITWTAACVALCYVRATVMRLEVQVRPSGE